MKGKITPIYYASMEYDAYMNTRNLLSVAMMKCSECGEKDLKPIWKYCPNCGKEFEKE